MTTKTVKAPKGFHWMKKGSSFKLMKGTYKPHKGAVKMAKFTLQKKHNTSYITKIIKGLGSPEMSN